MPVSRPKSQIRLRHAASAERGGVTFLFYYSDDKGVELKEKLAKIDADLEKRVSAESEMGALTGAADSSAWFQTDRSTYFVLCGGASQRRDESGIRFQVEKAVRAILARRPGKIQFMLLGSTERELMLAGEAAVAAGYQYRTTKTDVSNGGDQTVDFILVGDSLNDEKIKEVQITGMATVMARELSILPANEATPEGVVARAKDWAKELPLSFEVYNRQKCREMGMGCFVSVSQGAENEPQMLVMKYAPKGAKSKTCLGIVGKGVTFDTGGYNLKTGMPYKMLIDMKADMGGAAATIGAMLAIAELAPSVEVVGIAGLTENMISGKATKPGDVVKSFSGKTVEIQNTDAEGRLVLADALTLARKEGVTHIVDVATLTGACVVALGSYYSGLMTNNSEWAKKVTEVCNTNGEPVWELPLNFRHADEIRSDVADFSNMGKGREGGTLLAGSFLSQFVETTPWVHLDIAGTGDYSVNNGFHGTAKYSGVMASSLARLSLSLD